MNDNSSGSLGPNPKQVVHDSLRTPYVNEDKRDKNKILVLILKAYAVAWVLWLLGAGLLLTIFGDGGVYGLMLLPLVLMIWVLTPLALISLIVLAIKTRNPIYMILTALISLVVIGFIAYDIFIVAARN